MEFDIELERIKLAEYTRGYEQRKEEYSNLHTMHVLRVTELQKEIDELKANRAETLVRQGDSQPMLRTDIEEKYNELIMAVAKKFTNETRHETALRYIKEAESFNDNTCAKNESEQSA